jgi:hypothetical protein
MRECAFLIAGLRCVAVLPVAALLIFSSPSNLRGQTYAPPANGDYGGTGSFSVFVDVFTNQTYPTGNGTNLIVSVFHPNATVNPALPTIFFAHGFTSPVGNAADYGALLTNLASQGYNVVFSPYEGGTINATIPQRFDELATGFEGAVSKYGLNTARVGFAGHSYGGGFLPAVILHEMMGMADQFTAGHTWGGTAAFFYSMAPGYAYAGAGQTIVAGSQTIFFPTNLNVVEQVFNDDTSIADPRLAIDIFYNITTLNSQKDFLTVNGDDHGTPPQVADHFLPNSGSGVTSTSLQAWGIFRHIDALAAYTFTGDANARQIALGGGVPAQTYEGVWSDGTNVAPMNVTDIPSPSAYPSGPYVVQWSDAANPRGNFPLVSGPPQISGVQVSSGQALVTAGGLLNAHSYVEQTAANLTSANWSNAISFTATQTSQTLTNAIGNSQSQFWRLLAP